MHNESFAVLFAHGGDVLVQRYWRGSRILRALKCLTRLLCTLTGNQILIPCLTQAAGAAHFDEFLPLEKFHDRIDHACERQLDDVGNLMPRHVSTKVQHLKHQIGKIEQIQSSIFKSGYWWWRP